MRKRRRNRGTWFPTLGTIPAGELPDRSSFDLELAVQPSGEPITGIIPLTYDFPQEGDNLSPTADTLVEIVGNEYIIQRIVGKCAISYGGSFDLSELDGAPLQVRVAAGFFVARAQDSEEFGSSNLPIGTTTAGAVDNLKIEENYGLFAKDTIREPWMWRRTWVLNLPGFNTLASALGGGGPLISTKGAGFPSTNLFGSVAEGSMVDVKSKRRVRLDERLWFVASAYASPTGILVNNSDVYDVNQEGIVNIWLDARLFGSLRKAHGKSSF